MEFSWDDLVEMPDDDMKGKGKKADDQKARNAEDKKAFERVNRCMKEAQNFLKELSKRLPEGLINDKMDPEEKLKFWKKWSGCLVLSSAKIQKITHMLETKKM